MPRLFFVLCACQSLRRFKREVPKGGAATFGRFWRASKPKLRDWAGCFATSIRQCEFTQFAKWIDLLILTFNF